MQMSALDTDCTSGTGKIHAFTLNFTEIGSRRRMFIYERTVSRARALDIYDFQSHLSLVWIFYSLCAVFNQSSPVIGSVIDT